MVARRGFTGFRDPADLEFAAARAVRRVDSSKLRRLLVERTGGITLGICKAFERAAIAAIRDGHERIDLKSFDDPETWRGVATASRARRPQSRDLARTSV